jgi:hypothetical protein
MSSPLSPVPLAALAKTVAKHAQKDPQNGLDPADEMYFE